MSAERTVSLSFRVSPRFARLLETAAALEHRSKTNLVETLVLQFCQAKGIDTEGLTGVSGVAPTKVRHQRRGV